MVWHYIAQGWIKPRLVRLASQIADGAEAEYKPDSHTLWFRRDTYGTRPEERAAIIHQCTHALRDIMAGSALPRRGWTAAALASSSTSTTRRPPTSPGRSSTCTTITAPNGRSAAMPK